MLSKTAAVLHYGSEEELKIDVLTKGPVGAVAKVSLEVHLPLEYVGDEITWDVDHIGPNSAFAICDAQGEEGTVSVLVDAGSNEYTVDVVITGSDGQPHAFTGYTGRNIQATVTL